MTTLYHPIGSWYTIWEISSALFSSLLFSFLLSLSLLSFLFIFISLGAHLALPFLTQFREAMVRVKEEENKEEYDNGKGKDDAMKDAKDGKKRKESRFQPERNHLYSGRNNDNKGNISELYYFFTKIIPKLLFTPKLGDGEVCCD